MRLALFRHCEKQRDEAIQGGLPWGLKKLDCRAPSFDKLRMR
ncbi:hypothetical protein MNBD_ALPHA12-2209, partial [hydrothermal vent metagenome]